MEAANHAIGSVPTEVPTAPEHVTRAAAERGLGHLVDARPEASPGQRILVGWGLGGAALALMAGIGVLVETPSMFSFAYDVLRFVVLFLFFFFIWGFVFGLRGVVQGTRGHYLFAGGLVHRRRSRAVAVPWPEVEVLETVYDRQAGGTAGKVLGYRVRPTGGRPFIIPLDLVDGRDRFIDAVLAALHAHGRPVR